MASVVTAMTGLLQKRLARSRLAVRFAIKLKNQCEMVIGARLSDGRLPEESGELWLARLVAPHVATFVDVGGNVGAWTLIFASHMKQKPRGLVFEPHPQAVATLRAALQAAGLDQCVIIDAAAADRTGYASFFAEPDCGETSSLHAAGHHDATAAVRVRLCRLDDELAARNIAALDFLKIDAEGHDYFVMRGAEKMIAARSVQVIQFEYNAAWIDAGATLTRAFALLTSCGYTVRLLRADGLYAFDVARCGEVFKYSNFVAFVPGAFGGVLDALPVRSVL